jgi:outer membrane protein OmpA-like peptidoglycan-associated protein
MMIRVCALIFCFCQIHIVSAQLSVTINEDFSSNKLGWYEGDRVFVKDGHYELDAPEGGWQIYINPYINTESDFRLEATFTQIDGNIDNGFGFIWGFDKAEKLNRFIISTNGFVQIHTPDETRADAKDWIESKIIKPLKQGNRLKIEQTKGEMKFYVNGEQVQTMKALPWFGKTIGFVCYTKMKFQVDDLVFAQSDKINLPPDLKQGLKKENLGSSINTKYDELAPKISGDGKTIFFGRDDYPENLGGEADPIDFWMSSLSKNGQWTKAMNVGRPINSEGVDNILSVSNDNNSILVATANDFKLYERSQSGWQDKGLFGIHYETESEFLEACQSADGKAILFTMANKQNVFYQKGEKAEKDIYVSLKDSKNKWSAPINLGPAINSNGDEVSPFLAADGRTLYFATDGRPGYGDQDIFMSKRIGDGWTNWTEPVNLGPEINTLLFDAYYTVPASGDYAYLVTNANENNSTDLERVKLPKEIRPEPVVLVSGKVMNAKTKTPIEADIIFENITTSKEAGEAISNPKTGEYRIALPYGASYGFRAVAPGYLSVNENLSLVDIDPNYLEINKDLFLVPIEIGQSIQLQNVFFVQSKAELKPESYLELDRLAETLLNNKNIIIEVSGHTDNRGDARANSDLSDNRVKTVISYLVSKNIDKKRMSGKGYGGSKPLYPNDTDEHRQMNRRVEFKIVKK